MMCELAERLMNVNDSGLSEKLAYPKEASPPFVLDNRGFAVIMKIIMIVIAPTLI